MTRAYGAYSDQDIINRSKEVNSLSGLLKAIGLKPVGGNFENMRRHLDRLKVDTSHWKGKGWNLGYQLKEFSNYKRVRHVKIHLMGERGRRCEKCKLSEWQSNPIPLELHHKDGDRTYNDETNLELLCPNCHALTPTWRGRITTKLLD